MKLLHQGNHNFTFSRKPNLDYPAHVHNAVEIVIMEQGHSTVISGKDRYRLEAGDIFVSFPNQIHGYENSTDYKGYVLILPIHPNLTPYRSFLLEQVPVDPFLRKGQWEHTGILTLIRMAYADRKTAQPAVLQGYWLVIVGKLLSLLTLQDARAISADALHAALVYVNNNYTLPLTRGDVAKATGYTESYISHIFSSYLNTSFSDYVTSLRLLDARKLLSGTDRPISAIAMELGFGSIRSFHRIFAAQVGITPQAYRQTSAQGSSAAPSVR